MVWYRPTTLSFIVLFLLSAAVVTTAASNGSLCESTPDPIFCQSFVSSNLSTSASNSSGDVYDYGRFSIGKAHSAARKFLHLMEKTLRKSPDLTVTAVRALEDCKLLAELNLDYLASSFQVVSNTSKVLPTLEADDVLTLLSAILTNTQTCLDGLKETSSTWSVRNGIVAPLATDNKLFRLSLALFTKGWVPKKKKVRPPRPQPPPPFPKPFEFTDGQIPMRMSENHRRVYEIVSNRKLLQSSSDNTSSAGSSGGDAVLINDIVIVSQDGTGNFTTVSDAVDAAPKHSDGSAGYYLIYVTAGIYEEYVSIGKSKKYLMMVGDGINKTVITGNHSFVDGWTTFNSSTFAVVGEGFIGVNFTIQNTAGAVKHQAVALRNGADLSIFYSCSFEGYQDTLYVHSLRQFYRDCDVYGTVDFIFGNAAAVFQNCNLYPRLPLDNQFNAITAQGRTDPNQNTGISIQNCSIIATDELKSSSLKTFLGRPWKLYSRTIYMESYIDGSVDPTGWREWNGDLGLNTTYYAEFNNTGPGANTSGRVNWIGYHVINSTDALNFTVGNFLLGEDWIWPTGVPYASGLLSTST